MKIPALLIVGLALAASFGLGRATAPPAAPIAIVPDAQIDYTSDEWNSLRVERAP